MAIIVTGAAGFIGRAVCERLLARHKTVVGVDNFNSYYDPALKEARVATSKATWAFAWCGWTWRRRPTSPPW